MGLHDPRVQLSLQIPKYNSELGGGDSCLSYQHLGGRGRLSSRLEASLVYIVIFQDSQGYTERNSVSEKKQKHRNLLEMRVSKILYKAISAHLIIKPLLSDASKGRINKQTTSHVQILTQTLGRKVW